MEEFHSMYEGKDVPASLEEGHSGKHVVGAHEETIQRHRVTRIGEDETVTLRGDGRAR